MWDSVEGSSHCIIGILSRICVGWLEKNHENLCWNFRYPIPSFSLSVWAVAVAVAVAVAGTIRITVCSGQFSVSRSCCWRRADAAAPTSSLSAIWNGSAGRCVGSKKLQCTLLQGIFIPSRQIRQDTSVGHPWFWTTAAACCLFLVRGKEEKAPSVFLLALRSVASI
jgi:hypothetical protein